MFPTVLGVLRSPDLFARVLLRRELRSFLRLQFLTVALEAGLLERLLQPASFSDLAADWPAQRRATLNTLLDLGVALGELRRRGTSYRVRRNSIARALAGPTGRPMRAAVLELVDYHAGAYRDLPDYLRGAQQRDYLAGREALIASSSQLVEPVVGALVRRLVRGRTPMRVLELGCGSAVYMRHAHDANPAAVGVGLEREAELVSTARTSLERWGISDRFAVQQGDARLLGAELSGDFDLITLFNNIYYFAPAEREALMRDLRSRLTPRGRLAIVSMMRGRTPASLGLSLVLAATRGCTELPTESQLLDDLRESGFAEIARRKLLPGEPLVALIASVAP